MHMSFAKLESCIRPNIPYALLSSTVAAALIVIRSRICIHIIYLVTGEVFRQIRLTVSRIQIYYDFGCTRVTIWYIRYIMMATIYDRIRFS